MFSYKTLFSTYLKYFSFDSLLEISGLQLSPKIIILFTMRTLIEYCNTDISNIKFIILNMFEKVAKHSCKVLSNAA